MATRILGIDYGSRRVGIALSDEGLQFALPHSVIDLTDHLGQDIQKVAVEFGVKEVVLGESRNYKGEPNAILTKTLEFKTELESAGYIVHLEPEFMTSMHAEKLQGKTDMTDASAAALILQSFLDRSHNAKVPHS